MEMDKAYEPQKFEKDIYKMWEEGGYFQAKVDKNKKPYTIMMPPPNATGVLHIGHGVYVAIQDLMIRYKRMNGYSALWLPGTDHAAIATQTKVEKILAKEGKTRQQLGREEFLKQVREFVEHSKATIQRQLRRTGASCDWSREAYTFSDELSMAVNTAFKKMYDDGLIYRGNRIVNWCPRCGSTLADDELEYKNEVTKLYTFKYDKDFPITIATTRPETKLGDTAIAVNPDDERYQKYIGKVLEADFCGKKLKIKVIADDGVEKDFGTGALGVTPAHSLVDFEMAQKNKLPVIKVIDEFGKMNDKAEGYENLSVVEAREKIVECLKKDNLLEKEEEIEHNLSVCYRCQTAVEPLTSEQWFVDVNKKIGGWNAKKLIGLKEGEFYSIKDVSRLVVKSGQIKIWPKNFLDVYFSWMDNLRDWCISRQIWWGHQIPVWYRTQIDSKKNNSELALGGENSDQEIYVGINPPDGEGWMQDKDTLDTWFSSGLWTFSTLGWPHETEELKYFHPTSLLETGRDIIFQWVARMIIMSTYLMGEIPFENVYFHGMLQNKDGSKMSKSSGVQIDPEEMIDKYGADALRLSLIVGNAPGIDFRYYEEKIIGQRNFVNKFWNVSRFIIGNLNESILGEIITKQDIRKLNLKDEDKWILSRLGRLSREIARLIDEYKFSLAVEELYTFVWNDLADWYLEIVKSDLVDGVDTRRIDLQKILSFVLTNILKISHPFMPFVTEVIWQNFSKGEWGKLIVSSWPEKIDFEDDQLDHDFEELKETIAGVRKMLIDFDMNQQKNLELILKPNKAANVSMLSDCLKRLVRNVAEVRIVKEVGKEVTNNVFKQGLIGFVVSQEVKEIQKKRFESELVKIKEYRDKLHQKLANPSFADNAPKEVVKKEKEKLSELNDRIKEILDIMEKI